MTRVLAVVVAYNEADVMGATLAALAEQGCDAYVIDHGSTDGTADIARAAANVVGVEHFPGETMVWRDLLARREQVVREHDYDWYVNNDADEFREAPWPGLTLAEGLARAEALGYNAVNFRVLNFRPTGEGFRPGDDPRAVLTRYEPADRCDTPQVKAFKRPDGPLDVVGAGGHDVRFDGRRVCPIPFILRHYPIRSPEHGRRKVLAERLPRFDAAERADGWHVQYDDLVAGGARFTWDAATLTEWKPDRVRAELLAAAAETILTATVTRGVDLDGLTLDHGVLRDWVGARLGAPVPPPDYNLARAAFDRLLAGDDPVEVATTDAHLAPVVLRLLDAVAAQLEVAGQVVQQASVLTLQDRYAAATAPPFVAYLDADEAVASPDLLATFASAFGAAADATLVLAGEGWAEDRLAAELGPLIDDLGDDVPDFVAVTAVPEDLPDRVHAVLSARPPRPELAAVPHVADAARLRALAGAGR